ncbi:MAG: GIY-YIG nuclease family protein [Thermoplasmata archaeon]
MGYTERREKGDYRWVPDSSGIYRLYHGDRVVYVGQTNNLRARIAAHERGKTQWGSYDYKSTRYVNSRDRKRMEERAIVYNRPTRNRS